MTYLKFFLAINAICDDGYTYWNGYCYKGNSSAVLPIEGELQCQAEGGHEVSIHSQEVITTNLHTLTQRANISF